MITWINNSLNKVSIAKVIAQVERSNQPVQENLAGKILQLQFQCQGQHGTKQLIVQLIKLYTQAVQYYQEENNNIYYVFKKRMEQFLKKQNIDEILRGKSGELVCKKDSATKKLTHARTKSISQVNKILDKSQKIFNKKQQLVQKVLDQQQQKLKNRIQKRKTMSNRSSHTQDQQQNQQNNNTINPNILLNDIFQRQNDKKNKKVFI